MCGRFGLTRPDRLDLRRFGVESFPAQPPRYNIAPGTPVLAVRSRSDGNVAGLLRWGLVPWWARDAAIGGRLANVRSDTAFDKFREAMRQRRCLIPADVFYEWRVVAARRPKQPYAIGLRAAGVFALGGIWEYWRPEGRDGEVLLTCAVLTTEPNDVLAHIHDRMPVIVDVDDFAAWLDPHTAVPQVRDLVRPLASGSLRVWPIGTRVNRAEEDDEGLLEPIADGR